jgi:porin
LTRFANLTAACVLFLAAPSAIAAEQALQIGFGGPDATENQIKIDREPRTAIFEAQPLQNWSDWKEGLTQRRGIAFSLDYSAVLLTGDGMTQDNASAGMARFYGAWDLTGQDHKNAGAFVWKIEHRHGFTEPPPNGFAIQELGYIGVQEPPFSDQGIRVTNLYWRQRFQQGRMALIGGFLDVTDFVDVYALSSPWMHFMNFAFSTGSATMALPNDAALGVGFGAMLNKNFFVIANVTDANSDPTKPFEGFDTFFNEREFFESIELGWTTEHARLFFDNYHATFWHKDRQDQLNVPDGWGANFSFTRYVNDRWLPFLRGGWAEDGGSLLEQSLSAGIGYQLNPGADLLGFGLNWGKPNEKTFGPGLDDQYSAELFYRFNVGRQFALTADIQYLKDPAQNTVENSLWMFNLRGRVVF